MFADCIAWRMLSRSLRPVDVVYDGLVDEVRGKRFDEIAEADKTELLGVDDMPAVVLMSPSWVSFQAELPMTDPRSTFPSGEVKPRPRAMK